jgi:hypothetical protein
LSGNVRAGIDLVPHCREQSDEQDGQWTASNGETAWQLSVAVPAERGLVSLFPRMTARPEVREDVHMTDSEPNFFQNPKIIDDPKSYFDHMRSKCPVSKEPYLGTYGNELRRGDASAEPEG